MTSHNVPTNTKCVAIIVPAFNAAGTIRETLVSIQRQRSGLERVEEVILIDDASTDETSALASSAWTSNVPFRLIRNVQNIGERATINGAVQLLSSEIEWLLILHADDLAKPHWLEMMLKGIDEATADIASLTASYDVLYPNGRITPGENRTEVGKVMVEGTAEAVRGTLKRGCWFKISSCAIRVSAFHRVGGFRIDLPQLGDWEFTLKLLRDGWTIEYIPLCLSVYRQSAHSVSSESFRRQRDVIEALSVFEEFSELLTRADVVSWHLRRMYVLARRACASAARLNLPRMRSSGAVAIMVTGSLYRTLRGTRQRACTAECDRAELH